MIKKVFGKLIQKKIILKMKFSSIKLQTKFLFFTIFFKIKDFINIYRNQNQNNNINKISSMSTYKYVKKYLSEAKLASSRREIHEIALSKTFNMKGLILEFGVYSGYTIN